MTEEKKPSPESGTNTQDSGQTEQPVQEQKTSRVEEASDAELDAFLASFDEEAPAEEAQPEGRKQEAEPEPEGQDREEQEQPQEEVVEQPDSVSRDEFDAVVKQLQGQELLLQRRTSAIAELERKLSSEIQQLRAGLNDKFLENPSQALDDKAAIDEKLRTLQEVKARQNAELAQHQTQKLVAQYIKPGEVNVEDMVQSLREDGIAEDHIQRFQRNPWAAGSPEAVLQLAKRAKAERLLRQIAPVFKQMLGALQQQNEKPQEVLKRVQEATKKAPGSVNASFGGASVRKPRAVNPHAMSDEELNELIERGS